MTEQERAFNKALAGRIAAEARRAGKSLFELSQMARVPHSSLCGYVAEGRGMTAWTLKRLCEALGVSPESMIRGA